MKIKLKICAVLLLIITHRIYGQDSTVVIGDSIHSAGLSISIDDLKQRAEDARQGVYYSFGSEEEEKIYSQYLNSRIFALEKDLENKSKEIDSLKKIVTDFIKKQEEYEKNQKEGWRKLERYLSMEQVEKLLGKPQAITKYPTYTKYWYGNGFVEFNAFKKVSEWAEPRKERTEIIKY